jgi:hypothetical protein
MQCRSVLPRAPSSFATGPTFIFRLPQELLISIIELAVFEVVSSHGCSDCDFRPNGKCAKALSRVCWRISRIAQPMLFHTISLEGTPSTVPPKKGGIRVHLALRQNPSLRRHCRRFALNVTDGQQRPQDWSIAKDLAKWLSRVRCFECYGGFQTSNQKTWGLIQNMMQKLESLRHWKVSREARGLHLQSIVNALIPRLEILDLSGISEWKEPPLTLDPKVDTEILGDSIRRIWKPTNLSPSQSVAHPSRHSSYQTTTKIRNLLLRLSNGQPSLNTSS